MYNKFFMKLWVLVFFLLSFTFLKADASLTDLAQYDKLSCLERLEQASTSEIWSAFLDGQTQLYFNSELKSLKQQSTWQESQCVFDIGCGNGTYLYKLALEFPEKNFNGIEKLNTYIESAQERYFLPNLSFAQGDAEIYNPELTNAADIVLFRLTLQHLDDPYTALKNASKYLHDRGFVFIIDAFDKAKEKTHPIPSIEEALQRIAENQQSGGKGNRKITMELFQQLKNGTSNLSDNYEVIYSNLDIDGIVIDRLIVLQGDEDRKRYFNHSLLFLTLLSRNYNLSVDMERAYEELVDFVNDQDAYWSPGMHFLILKKV